MDHISDTSHKKLYHLTKEASLPSYVMEHDLPDNLNDCETSCFADPVKREFPIHTKADTYLSYAYAKEASLGAHAQDRLDKAIKLWDLEDDIKSLDNKEVK